MVGLAIVLVLSNLIRNWTKELNWFVDINDILYNFKLLIDHNQAKSEEILIDHIQDGLAIDFNSPLAKTATRFLVIIIPGSY